MWKKPHKVLTGYIENLYQFENIYGLTFLPLRLKKKIRKIFICGTQRSARNEIFKGEKSGI